MKHGDVLRIRFASRGGREQSGVRPAILMQQDEGPQRCPTLVVVPLTSQLSATRFGNTVELAPAEHTGLRVRSVAMVFQMTAVDRGNVLEQLGSLSTTEYSDICNTVLAMIAPPAIES